MSLGDPKKFLELFEAIRQDECRAIYFCCSNPDFNDLPEECVDIHIFDDGGTEKEFRADTLVGCLELAQLWLRAEELKTKLERARNCPDDR